MDNSITHVKVLLVEDNPGDARLIRIILDESGSAPFDVEWVDSLQKGLDRASADAVDIVLLDLGLPDSHGIETFLRFHDELPDIPVVVLTGLADEELATEAVRSGAQDYLVKGQDNNLLSRAIRYAIERRRLEEERKIYTAKLERSNRELQDFAFVASHDLQEPLRKIHSFGERLREKYGDILGVEGIDYLTRMQSASERMQELLQALLSYSRISTRANPFTPVDLNEVVRETLSDLDMRIEEAEARIEVGDLAVINADASQMRQLFQNLINNSLKFHGTDRPFIKIYGETVDDRKVKSEKLELGDGPWYRIYVEDKGIGFDEKNLDRIFQPFQRLHGRSQYEGTGMGLAICRKIVLRHGGEITARSKPGEGATFIITLPIEQREGDKI